MKIAVLPPHIANLIAAGEVVERPAAALKELVENAADAGASVINAEIRSGGNLFIRVTDDGCGMSPEDAETAFLRHATSKIRSEEDLRRVKTMGFRGEALAAIAAVSRVELTTREPGADFGHFVSLEAGEITESRECGCAAGTSITIRDLFFNTPARQKFLKKDASEAAHSQGVIVRAAQSRPDISFVLTSDGREVLRTPGDGILANTLSSLWGSAKLMPIAGEYEGMSVRGFVGAPEFSRGSRGMQYFFVNNRPIRSGTLTAALDEAFKHSLTVGRYPVCSAHISMSEELCDCNVHPSKLEIKFANERPVFELLYGAARDALMAKPAEKLPESKPFPVMRIIPEPVDLPGQSPAPEAKTVSYAKSQIGMATIASPLRGVANIPKEDFSQIIETPKTQQYQYLGEVYGGFVLAEIDGKLIVIDKHAAHERYVFDRLKTAAKAMPQTLIEPRIVPVTPETAQSLTEYAADIASAGIDAQVFGAGSAVIRVLPDGVDAGDAAALLEEVVDALKNNRDPHTRLERVLETVACKAAVKIGKRFSKEEALEVISWIACDDPLKTCPHGRPVSFEITEAELRKRFSR